MSNQYDETNRGAIWKNENRQSDKHPHFSGSINIDGKDYWLSGWKKAEGASDRAPLVSFSVRPKDENPSQGYQKQASAPAPQAAPAVDDFEDDIPF